MKKTFVLVKMPLDSMRNSDLRQIGSPYHFLCSQVAQQLLGKSPLWKSLDERYVFEVSTQPFVGSKAFRLWRMEGGGVFYGKTKETAEYLFREMQTELSPFLKNKETVRIYAKISLENPVKSETFSRKYSYQDFYTKDGEWALCLEAVERFSSLPDLAERKEIAVSVSDNPFENCQKVDLDFIKNSYGEVEIGWIDPSGLWRGYSRVLLLPMQKLIKSIRPDFESIKTLYFRFD